MAYEEAAQYEEKYQTKYRKADILEKRLLKEALTKHIDAGGRVLEVGCGTAHFTSWMETLGFDSYGADISSSMLREAKKRWGSGQLVKSDAAALPFTEKSFDATAFITSLEFIGNAEEALKEAARVSRNAVILGLLYRDSKEQAQLEKSGYYDNARFYSRHVIERMLKHSKEAYREVVASATLSPKTLKEKDAVIPFGFRVITIELGEEA